MRTHYCQSINLELLDAKPILCGWVLSSRDHGGIIFIDLRDSTGIVQLVFDPQISKQNVELVSTLKNESVIKVQGLIRRRPEGTVNKEILSGDVELVVHEISILNLSENLPFALDDQVSEEVKLTYRYLDIRKKKTQHTLKLRSDVLHSISQFLHSDDFQWIETPMLTKSTPEGARDFLVPSRTHQGAAFALPQSPQLFKQMLMVSGIEKYYQIVKCFRDEDLRADRQPEFTQLDLEMAFVNEKDIMRLGEDLIRHLFQKHLQVDLSEFQVMTYAKSMEKFGTDAPDLRNPLELLDIKPLMKHVNFQVFQKPANENNSKVIVMRVTGGNKLTRKQIDDYTQWVGKFGAKGLAYIRINDVDQSEGLQSPILKFLDQKTIEALIDQTQAKTGDLLFFGAGKIKIVNDSFSALRDQIAKDLNLLTSKWAPVWIIDFPMFDEKEGKLNANHHPFTLPCDLEKGLENPRTCLSHAYDLVLNGHEIGGGSLRIHDPKLQTQVLKLCGLSEAQIQKQFGFFIRALSLGAPPHGGMAFGVDRLLMLMSLTDNIRDVIAFPKTQSARCLLTDAPSEMEAEQMRELSIRLIQKQ